MKGTDVEVKYNFDLDLVFNNSLLLIAKQIRKNSLVLEFGPANGRLTKYLKDELKCEVYLVEIDVDAGRQAANYAKDIVYGDIENFDWMNRYDGLKFDYILFADVLEHLRDPEIVLNKAKLFLKQEGSILFSVPNIAHNSVVINLINGKFDYTQIGLLDNTHIHFFTKKSLEEMLSRTGLVPIKKMGTYNEVGDNEIQNTYGDVVGIDESFWKYREYGDVYQFVYEVKNGIEYVDEKLNFLKKYFKPYFVQCYFDEGQGFREEYSQCKNLYKIGENVQYEFDVNSDIIGFRIDPINKECIIEEYSCEIFDESGWSSISYCKTNADAFEGKQYYFFNRDPGFEYRSFNKKISRIRVLMKIVTIDINKINIAYDTMLKIKSINNIV